MRDSPLSKKPQADEQLLRRTQVDGVPRCASTNISKILKIAHRQVVAAIDREGNRHQPSDSRGQIREWETPWDKDHVCVEFPSRDHRRQVVAIQGSKYPSGRFLSQRTSAHE